jgi:hypothetical protein
MKNQRAVRSAKAGHHTLGMRSGHRIDRHEPSETCEPMPTMDIGTALDLIAAAVNRLGADFVYQPVWVNDYRYLTCLYAHDGAPDCIVGHVLADAGVRPQELEAMRDDGIDDLYRAGRLPIALTLGALAVLQAAQQSQDRGRPWADVLADANAMAVRVLDLAPTGLFAHAGDRAADLTRTSEDDPFHCLRSH